MREVLEALDRESAFQTLGRFDLLPGDHLPYRELGARDVDGELRRSIETGEGVITVIGRMGSGKSSLIAAVANSLDEGFVPLRVSVIGVEAGSPAAFARHAITEIRDSPEAQLTRHETLALDRAAAEHRTKTSSRELRAGFEIGGGGVLTAKVAGDIKRAAGDELNGAVAPGTVVRGVERLFGVFWKLKRCPVVIIEDTDHWGGSPEIADAFFDQTSRAFGTMDAVTVVATQTDYTNLDGYLRIRDKLACEVVLPQFPNMEQGLIRVMTGRMASAGVTVGVDQILEPGGIQLLVHTYAESVSDGRAGDLRRTLAVMRAALEAALSEPTAQVVVEGHVQEALARTPLAPSSALGNREAEPV